VGRVTPNPADREQAINRFPRAAIAAAMVWIYFQSIVIWRPCTAVKARQSAGVVVPWLRA